MKATTKRLAALLLSIGLCFFVSACAPWNDNSVQTTGPEGGELILLESGWSATDGYVHYGLVFENTSDSLVVASPTVVITAHDEKRKVLFTDSQTLEILVPPGIGYYGAAAGNGTIPDTVDFSLTADEGSWRDADGSATPLLSIGSTEEIDGVYGTTSFVGDLLANAEWGDGCGAVVSVVLRNGNNEIVYGANVLVDSLAANQASVFEINVVDAPSYSAYEINALQQEK